MAQYQFRAADGASADAPLIFLFHGTGGDENQFFDLAAELAPGAARIAPRGDVSEHGALRYFRRTGEGVYDMADLAQRTAAMTDFIRTQATRRGSSEIWGLGYSNGANILANVLIEEGVFDKAALMHPLIPFRPKDNAGLQGRRVLITAGERDPICPAPLTQALADYFQGQGAATETEWHSGGHDIRQNEITAIAQFLKE